MNSLVINGSITSNSIEIKDHIVQFYKMYSEQCSWQTKLDRLSFLSIDADERGWLDRESEENELWEVEKDLNCDKVPAPDGFSMAFFPIVFEGYER